MPFTKIMVHLVWSTKNRNAGLRKEIRNSINNHIRKNAAEKGIFIEALNCQSDHVHCLISLTRDQNISKVAALLKGESSHWINQQDFSRGKFAWQNDYFAVSVSESSVQRVRAYIDNQDAHHRKKTFQDEYDEFLRLFGFKELA